MDVELQQAYQLKERTEAEIGDRRKALAFNDALLRACHERLVVLPEFEDRPSTSEEAQATQGWHHELFAA
jgi:hypothetical protein